MNQLFKSTDESRPGFIALGSNLPYENRLPIQLVNDATKSLSKKGFELVNVSSLYVTSAYPAGSGPDFVNAVAEIRASVSPIETLACLHKIEVAFGRNRDVRWGPRTLDLDLIALGDLVLPDAEAYAAWRGLSEEEQMSTAPDGLVLPHPRLEERAFVLVPLAEIAPGWRHPVTGRSAAEMRDALPAEARADVRLLPQP